MYKKNKQMSFGDIIPDFNKKASQPVHLSKIGKPNNNSNDANHHRAKPIKARVKSSSKHKPKPTKPKAKVEPKKKMSGFLTSSNDVPYGNYEPNIALALSKDKRLTNSIRYNTFNNSPYIYSNEKWKLIDDNIINDIKFRVEKEFHFIPGSDRLLTQAINKFSRESKFNPIIHYLKSAEADWDGKHRIKTLFHDYLGAKDDAYTEMAAIKFMCGAVARILHPGIEFELMPILYGKQGIGKSTLIKKLFGKYDITNLNNMNPRDKETILQLITGWVCEISELGAMSNTKKEDVKNFLSSTHLLYRNLFDRSYTTYKTHNAFIGTTNDPDILTDTTGNRRFLPIKCGVVKPKYSVHDDLNQNTVKQILAEAVATYKAKGRKVLYISNDENKRINKIRKNYEAYSPINVSIKRYLNMPIPNDWLKYSLHQKYSYYQDYVNGDNLCDKLNDMPLKKNKVKPMTITTMRDIISIPLDETNPISAERSHIGHKVSAYISNLDNWVKTRASVNGRRIRVFKRIKTD